MRLSRLLSVTLVAGWALAALCANALAQWTLDGSTPQGNPVRGEWQQRVVQTGRAQTVAPTQTPINDYRIPLKPVYQQSPLARATGSAGSNAVRHASLIEEEPVATERIEEVPPGKARPSSGRIIENNYGEFVTSGSGCNCGGGDIGGCGDSCSCGECEECGECGNCGGSGCGRCFGSWLFREFSLFAGVQGFKSPADLGQNGNFGFNEGFNTGGPLGTPWPIGYQIGFRAAQSNLSGDRVGVADSNNVHGSTRHQVFATGGVFKRSPCGGLQWGVAFDYLHDSYFYNYLNDQSADLKQLRSETSLVGPNGNEIGFAGTYSIGGREIDRRIQNLENLQLNPTDMFTLFFRRQFEGNGEGRIWAGLTGQGDGLVGADLTVPLGRSWALSNHISYLIPKQGHGAEGQLKEAWGLSMQLVWYPGRSAACVTSDCYRPLFDVADNSSFIIHNPVQPNAPR
jgi:hypothetical protein